MVTKGAVCHFLQRAAADDVTHFPLTCAALTLSSYCVATATRENKASNHAGVTVTTVTSNLCFDELQDVCKTCTWEETETQPQKTE